METRAELIKKLLVFDQQAKAILTSGCTNDNSIADFKKHGFQDFLTMPFTPIELDSSLKIILQ